MEEAIEPLSQSLSMFLLDALLSTGNESMEQTDPALGDNQVSIHYYYYIITYGQTGWVEFAAI